MIWKNIEVNVEAYYKYFSQLSNINQNKLYEDIAEFDQIDDVFKKDFIIESGQSYGIDFLLKYSKNRLSCGECIHTDTIHAGMAG